MDLETKKALTADLAKRFEKAQTLYLTDFTGLNVKAMTDLRARFRAHGVDFVIAKNTLLRRAIDGLDLPDIAEHLQGPTGIVFGHEDPVAPARTLKEFARDHEERPAVKVAIVERRALEPHEVKRLADLPSREQLLGGIAGSMMAPVTGVVGAIAAVIRDIAYLVEEVARSREAV
jgi:large subunit ribosomal protein L10